MAAPVCSATSEPLTPQFAHRCNDCGHEFPDGFDDSIVATRFCGNYNRDRRFERRTNGGAPP